MRLRTSVLLSICALTGCFDSIGFSDAEETSPGPDPSASGTAGAGPIGGAAPAAGTVAVRYRTSIAPGEVGELLGDLRENDLFKFAENAAIVTARPPAGAAVTGVRIELDGTLVAERRLDAEVGASIEVPIQLPTWRWTEGVHPIRYIVDLSNGGRLEGEEEIAVHFNVTAIAADPSDPHQLWLGTFEAGAVGYHLGADPIDPDDDRFTALGGPGLGLTEVLGPAPADGFEVSTAPPGLIVLSMRAAHGGVYIGTAFRGLAWFAGADTPDVTADDRFARFQPGHLVGREDTWIDLGWGLAGSVTHIEPEGETGVWLGTLNGLFHLDHGGTPFDPSDDRWTVFEDAGRYDPNIAHLARDAAGYVWLAAFDISQDIDTADGARPARDQRNALVVLDPNGTPDRTDDDRWAHLDPPADFPDDATSLAIDGDRVWIGTTGGLWLLEHGGTPLDTADDHWQRFDRRTGLADEDIGAVLVRPDGRVWVGSFDVCGGEGGGLALLDPAACPADDWCPPVVEYTVADGLIDDDVSSLHALPGGEIVFGSFNALSAPIIGTLTGAPRTDECLPRDAAASGGVPGALPDPTRVGRDGLSVIDLGEATERKSDDAIVNL